VVLEVQLLMDHDGYLRHPPWVPCAYEILTKLVSTTKLQCLAELGEEAVPRLLVGQSVVVAWLVVVRRPVIVLSVMRAMCEPLNGVLAERATAQVTETSTALKPVP
jgi:hypothetical protein